MILVTDANVWIDLDNVGLTALVCALDHEFVSPDVILQELGPELAGRLLDQGLTSHPTDAVADDSFAELRALYTHPGDADLLALLLAIEHRWTLLTGDRHLREAAERHGLEVHGLLWVLDSLVAAELLAERAAALALQTILHQGARLPESECARRFQDWRTR